MMVSSIAIAGSWRDISKIKFPPNIFTTVHKFGISDLIGEFPDTSGFERSDFERLSSTEEDDSLLPIMKKCVDATLDFVNRESDKLCRQNFINVKSFLHTPKFGGKVWAVVGIVQAEAPKHSVGSRIIIAR